LVEAGQVVADIGMHLGYYTTLFAELVGTTGQVHAFEPTPSTREIAARNLICYPHVTVHPCAVWESTGTLTFRDYGVKWMAFNSFREAKTETGSPAPKILETPTATLDAIRASLARPFSLVKIDAESAEEEILAGAGRVLEIDRPLVSLEVGDCPNEASSRRAVDRLLSSDYRPWEFADGRFQPHQLKQAYAYDNLVFAPAGHDLSNR
jgi:FkbM family methyltransferase